MAAAAAEFFKSCVEGNELNLERMFTMALQVVVGHHPIELIPNSFLEHGALTLCTHSNCCDRSSRDLGGALYYHGFHER